MVQQQYEQKKRVYEATSISITSQMEPLKNQVKTLTDQLNAKEEEWKKLRQKITKAENLQEVVMLEMKNSMQSPRKPSKMEDLKKKVFELEQIVKRLEEVILFYIEVVLKLRSSQVKGFALQLIFCLYIKIFYIKEMLLLNLYST